MSNVTDHDLQVLHGLSLKGQTLDFKDEGETPEGLPIGSLAIRPSGLPLFPDGRWVTLPEARYVARYFGVQLNEA